MHLLAVVPASLLVSKRVATRQGFIVAGFELDPDRGLATTEDDGGQIGADHRDGQVEGRSGSEDLEFTTPLPIENHVLEIRFPTGASIAMRVQAVPERLKVGAETL